MSANEKICECSRPKCPDLGLGGVRPEVFVKSQCPLHWSVLLVYRILVTTYVWGYFLYDVVISVRPGGTYRGYYLIYLTNWGYVLMLVYLTCALWNLVVYHAFLRRSGWTSDDDGTPWYFFHRGQWLLFNMYASVAVLIAILYWSVVYYPGVYDLYYDINFHLLNGVFAIFEVLLTATVVRLLHVIYPFAFVVVYIIFSAIYHAAGGTDEEGNPYIYPVLDYAGRPGLAAGFVFITCFGAAACHVIVVWGLSKVKLLFISCLCRNCIPAEEGGDAEGAREMKNVAV